MRAHTAYCNACSLLLPGTRQWYVQLHRTQTPHEYWKREIKNVLNLSPGCALHWQVRLAHLSMLMVSTLSGMAFPSSSISPWPSLPVWQDHVCFNFTIGSNTNNQCLTIYHSPCHWSFLSITLYGYINTTNLLSVSKHDHNISRLTFHSWWLPKCRGVHRQQQQHDVGHTRQDYPSTTGTTLEAALSTVKNSSNKVRQISS